MNPDELRREYTRGGLHESDLASDPFTMFHRWLQQALEVDLDEPTAMTLSTATPDGRPSSRIVLLKDVSPDGFTFFTNYEGRKAREMAANPHAALAFYWPALERQVRIEGIVEKTSRQVSEDYFHRRPRGSQLSAWSSQQSEVVAGRDVLERDWAEREKEFHGKELSCPPFWGGYRLRPDAIEFWQGRANRLHDRLRYRRDQDRWIVERLSP